MKKFISISLFISACFLGSCSSYDDERIWQDLNEIEKTIGDYEAQAETLTKQMTSLSKVIGSSFITLISQDADGNHVISYSDGGGETHTVTIATQEDAIKLPIITAKQDTDSKFYWAQTTDKGKTYTFILDGDGKKFPIGGTMPFRHQEIGFQHRVRSRSDENAGTLSCRGRPPGRNTEIRP